MEQLESLLYMVEYVGLSCNVLNTMIDRVVTFSRLLSVQYVQFRIVQNSSEYIRIIGS